ncbi:hypothetical protein QM012_005980 [Aureobasidium pullulans]|uniref:Uncharacterized protein n=1 Tax=Aureobasidium pullulans TaxID=5580 RepID=A0ABR0TRM8_AURPU
METFRGIPISKIREHYMREGYRNEMFSSMVADVIEGNPGFLFELNREQPEQQEQRIWELASDEELPADPTEEEKEKKRAKNKKKYLRKKEKTQAEKTKLEQQKSESKDNISHGLADLSVRDAAPVIIGDRESSSAENNTVPAAVPPGPKLSKRQKKTLLKKAKQAQNKSPAPELAGPSSTVDSASTSNGVKSKASDDGHEQYKHEEEEKEVATESEVEAVMDTVAKRFGQ